MTYTLANTYSIDPRDNRDAYQDAMSELMKENDKIIHIDCDLMGCINTGRIKELYPERVFNAGIAEANALGVGAGMAAAGMISFMHTFAVFAGRRIFDQAFLSAGYSELPVHVIGSDPGVTAAINGATHMPFEDCGLYLNIPNALVLDPCDYAQTYALTKECAKYPYVSYMRLIRRTFKKVYADGSEFEIGKGAVLKSGKDVCIIASGIMVSNALRASEMLKEEGIDAQVIDMFCWKPLDEELIVESARKCGAIVTAENHQVETGLGSAISNVLARRCPTPQEFIGIQNRYGQAAPQAYLEEEYGLTAADIVKAAKRAIERKG
ncbi:MAG: hypothetical protein IKS54_02295 [Erysipelotrichaceae bacterium]|nr:hypothetical protein [Erysipelotrichaceae bacterium]